MATDPKPKKPVKKVAKKTTRVRKKPPTQATTTTPVTSADSQSMATIIGAFTEQAEQISRESKQYQEEWGRNVAKENTIFKRRNRILMILVCLLLLNAAFSQFRSVFSTGPLLDRVQTAVVGIENNQEGIDELVAFIKTIDAQACNGADCPPSQTEQLLTNFIHILCSSDDPGQQKACRELGYTPT